MTTTSNARAIAHHTNKLVEAIELANNAYLVTNAGGVVVFVASRFAAEGIARKTGQAVKHIESETYAVVVRVKRNNRPGSVE